MTGRRRGRPAGDRPDEDDAELFRRTFHDVLPIKRRGRIGKVPEPKPAAVSGRAAAPKRRAVKQTLPSPAAPPHVVHAQPALDAGASAGIDRRTADRFRRGKLPIDGRLDLHGMYQDAAHEALNRFVAGAVASDRRVLLVITGRGSREGSGVLRERLPHWLNMPALRPHILSFSQARPEHGGAGAFYVLLRRRRGERADGERGA